MGDHFIAFVGNAFSVMGGEHVDAVIPLGFVGEPELEDSSQLQGRGREQDSRLFGKLSDGGLPNRQARFDFPAKTGVFCSNSSSTAV